MCKCAFGQAIANKRGDRVKKLLICWLCVYGLPVFFCLYLFIYLIQFNSIRFVILLQIHTIIYVVLFLWLNERECVCFHFISISIKNICIYRFRFVRRVLFTLFIQFDEISHACLDVCHTILGFLCTVIITYKFTRSSSLERMAHERVDIPILSCSHRNTKNGTKSGIKLEIHSSKIRSILIHIVHFNWNAHKHK